MMMNRLTVHKRNVRGRRYPRILFRPVWSEVQLCAACDLDPVGVSVRSESQGRGHIQRGGGGLVECVRVNNFVAFVPLHAEASSRRNLDDITRQLVLCALRHWTVMQCVDPHNIWCLWRNNSNW